MIVFMEGMSVKQRCTDVLLCEVSFLLGILPHAMQQVTSYFTVCKSLHSQFWNGEVLNDARRHVNRLGAISDGTSPPYGHEAN